MKDAAAARFIGLSTVASGLLLMVLPRRCLATMGAEATGPAPLLFRVIGMFMAVSGGLLCQGPQDPLVLRWSTVQKSGAVSGVVLGVVSRQYRPRALAVAAFDAGSGLLLARMARRR